MARDRRAQTTVDFTVGVSVFLLTIAFAFAFVPGMLHPFNSGTDSTLVADRTATQLATDLLGSPSRPFVLNATCTAGFFDQLRGGPSAPAGCRFDTTASTVGDALGTGSATNLNVTMVNTTTDDVATLNGTRLAVGDDVPGTGSVTVARRIVSVDGETYRLEVKEW